MSDKKENKWYQKYAHKWIPLAGLVCGILLLLMGNMNLSGNKREEEANMVRYYTEALERRIESLCTSVAGIQEAEVLLTLENDREYVYAQNSTTEGSTLEYVILSRSNEEEAVLLTEICPRVRGVAVVCTGGDSSAVKQTIVSLLSASLGISSHRIHVAGNDGISES